MTKEFNDISADQAADALLSDEDIAEMRQSLWEDGAVSAVEADTILLANDELRGSSQGWTEFFVEAMTVYAVNSARPKGYVDDARARWFAARITDQGKLPGREELLLVVRILERATRVGEALRVLAHETFLRAVTEGEGPTRQGENAAPAGCITAEETELLRHILFAPGSERPAAVSKCEAELLFRIKEAALEGDNPPEWKELFVQGVANYLEGFSGAGELSADRALELEEFMRHDGAHIGSFFRRMASANPLDGVSAIVDTLTGKEGDEPGVFEQAAEDAKVTPQEHDWLDALLEEDGEIDEYEKALLSFLAEANHGYGEA
ncbi:MAG TPA: hypothetical protein VGA34_12925 [Alteraurantiacibacter sp.]|jgi:hypothetical protein